MYVHNHNCLHEKGSYIDKSARSQFSVYGISKTSPTYYLTTRIWSRDKHSVKTTHCLKHPKEVYTLHPNGFYCHIGLHPLWTSIQLEWSSQSWYVPPLSTLGLLTTNLRYSCCKNCRRWSDGFWTGRSTSRSTQARNGVKSIASHDG